MTTPSNLSWLPETLLPVALRLGRADALAGELGDVCLSWSRGENGEGPLDVVQVEREPGFVALEIRRIRTVPPIAGMLFSEIINHLRAVIDNVVYRLAEQAHGQPFTPKEATQVAFPIHYDEASYLGKARRLQKKYPQLAPGHPLGDRIQALQPFNDPRTVSAVPSGLGGMLLGDGAPDMHPLILLQRYSNDDKHRAIRLASGRTITRRDDEPPQPVEMKHVQVGDVVDRGPVGTYFEVVTMPALCVQRPDGGPWVSPGHELNKLFGYVADVAVPRLVTGLDLPDGFPAQIDLSDNNVTDVNRLEGASNVRAHDRMRLAAAREYAKMMAQPAKLPEIVEPN
ncbi:hypothetical protein ACFX43_16865 [Nocardioides sp. YIM B13467]|uniref:hypothetical protein n=1 Tax=Nocardioides sp. YIM B13467 TaxID=3366294 RepID=UPI00366E7592